MRPGVIVRALAWLVLATSGLALLWRTHAAADAPAGVSATTTSTAAAAAECPIDVRAREPSTSCPEVDPCQALLVGCSADRHECESQGVEHLSLNRQFVFAEPEPPIRPEAVTVLDELASRHADVEDELECRGALCRLEFNTAGSREYSLELQGDNMVGQYYDRVLFTSEDGLAEGREVAYLLLIPEPNRREPTGER